MGTTSAEARLRYYKKRKFLQYKGVDLSMRDSKNLASRLRRLMDHGFTYDAISRASGVERSTVINVVNRLYKTCSWETYERLNNFNRSDVFKGAPPRSLVPAYATKRRLQALQRIGWSFRRLDALLHEDGVPIKQCKEILNNTSTSIEVHEGVKRLYDRIYLTPGGDTARINYAKRNKWPAPLAWDDIDSYEERPQGSTNL